MMNPRVKQKWLKALRSDKYGKGSGALGKRRTNEYCCLGVLVCEMVPEFTHEEKDFVSLDNHGNSTFYQNFIPDDLAVLWGLNKVAQRELANVNDGAPTFECAITYIEAYL